MEEWNQKPLAIVGIGCRLPGGVRDAESLWQLLAQGESAITDIPADRWHIDRFYHDNPNSVARMVARRGGFVDQLKQFDAAFWGFSPREAMRLDPQQRWMLEATWESCENAGIRPSSLRGENVGVFVGASSHDFGSMQLNDLANLDVHSNTGGTLSIVANRISYLFDLHGPSLAIDTACSSALVAFSMACRSIWSGECNAAFAGGVNALLTPNTGIGFSKASMLSPSGECHAFDERADGYVRSEGAGMVLLKPLSEAVANGDRIYAAVRSAVVNQDGHTSSMTVPSAQRQSDLLRKALREADVLPKDISYVEAHGTGTPVGDPIEASAIGDVMSEGRASEDTCLVGSVKTNLGHLEPASGIAGLLKVALMFDRESIPPNRNFTAPNPAIPFQDLQLKVVEKLTPLTGHPQASLAAINSFGFGGTNASAVLQSPPRRISECTTVPQRKATDSAKRPFVLPISARDATALRSCAEAYCRRLENLTVELADFCYSAGARKEHHNHRLVVTGYDADELIRDLKEWLQAEGDSGHLTVNQAKPPHGNRAFVFTGQGSQWATMGQDLMASEPVAARAIEEVDALFQQISGWSLKAEMCRPQQNSNIHNTKIAQPAIFAVQVALVQLWRSWGIHPESVIGHSVGEVAAAWCAGIYSLEDATKLIYHRSRLQDTTGGSGKMLVAGVTAKEAQALIGDLPVEVTAVNSPSLVTIGGELKAVAHLEAKLRDDGKFVRDLGLDYAFHTYQMDPIKNLLIESLEFLEPLQESIPFISTVTGERQPGAEMNAEYWWQNVRQCVQFSEGVSTLADAGHSQFLEIGPHPALRSSLNECLGSQEPPSHVFHSIRRDVDASSELAKNISRMHLAGIELDWKAINQSAGRFVDQPSYPWNYQEYWLDEGHDAARTDAPLHPLLGTRLQAAKPTWELILDPNQLTYLQDHQIWDGIVFPASGFAEIGFAVAEAVFGDESYVVEDVQCLEALFVDAAAAPTIQVVFDEEAKSFTVYSSVDKTNWKTNACGRLVALHAKPFHSESDVRSIQQRLSCHVGHKQLYDDLHRNGYGFGDSFSLIEEIWYDESAPRIRSDRLPKALARIVTAELLSDDTDRYRIHPAILDACFQVTHGTKYGGASDEQNDDFFLPDSIRRVQLHLEHVPTEFWVYAVQTKAHGDRFEYDLHAIDIDGQAIATVQGFRVQRVQRIADHNSLDDCLYQFQWESQRIVHSGAEGTERDDASEPDELQSIWRKGAHMLKGIMQDPSGDNRAAKSSKQSVTLIFAGEDLVSSELILKLKRSDSEIIQLRCGNEFRKTSDHSYVISSDSVDDLLRVFDEAGLGDGKLEHIIHGWSLSAPEFTGDPRTLAQFQSLGVLSGSNLAKALESAGLQSRPRVTFITRGAQCTSVDDSAAGIAASPIIGFSRVANSEASSARWQVIDLDTSASDFEVDEILKELASETFESEVALRGSDRLVSRLHRIKLADIPERQRNLGAEESADVAYRLQMRKAGVLEDLSLQETPRRIPGSGEVEIRVVAGGINFRDVLKALGMYPGNSEDLLWFGDDFAGRVIHVGADVHDLKPGDRVCGITGYSFKSHVTVNQDMVFKLPKEFTFEQAASLPTAFMTAHVAINRIARMRSGERILIHAATGGVGQAAVQVAQHLGLEVFATAGTPEKRERLNQMGVAHVMDSRNVQFADQIMQITQGKGVDAVLNSLAGEFIPKSLSVLAPFGQFLEIGKIDVYGNSKIGLAALKDNISYHVIDLAQLITERPAEIAGVLRELRDRFAAGDYRPLPLHVYPVSEATKAFRLMAQGGHIGKNVLTFASDESQSGSPLSIAIGPCSEESHLFKSDASYLITGGAGGFGFEAAKWMAAQGAKNLVLMSRSSPDDATAAQITQLRDDGIEIVHCRGDVTVEEDVNRVIELIQSTKPQLKGVLHAAMVLDDDFIVNLDEQRFRRVLEPKMLGAWNLHNATRRLSIDHFICFSSFSTVIGAPKQANYNAGNSFLDALAGHRRAMGLPALTLNWGAILGAGFVDRNTKTAEYLDSMGLQAFQIREALEILKEMIQRDVPLLASARVDWQRMSKLSSSVSTLPIYSHISSAPEGKHACGSLQIELNNAHADQQQSVIEAFVAQQVGGVFGIAPEAVDRESSLVSLGIDSLMAVELMNRIETSTGILLSMSSMLGNANVRELSAQLLQHVSVSAEAKTGDVSDNSLNGEVRAVRVDFEAEAELDESIYPQSPFELDARSPRIFLTGATGFLGAHLLGEMLEKTDSSIVCLVRARTTGEGLRRVTDNLEKYGLDAHEVSERVEVVLGDLAHKRFMLSEDEFNRLAERVDVIFHNAADVNLALPYESLRDTNVFATKEMVRLACQGKTKPLHYVSTFMVQGTDANRGQDVTESDPLPPCDDLMYGYAQAKWVSEQVLQTASQRGVPVTIYRPGHVTGHSETGAANVNDLLHTVVRTCVLVGAAPFRTLQLDVSPVDYVASALVDLSLMQSSIGQIFHLTNPVPLTDEVLASWMQDGDANVDLIPYDQWCQRVSDFGNNATEAVENFDMLINVLMPRLTAGGNRGIHPRFDCQNTLTALSGTGIECPPANEDLLTKCYAYLQDSTPQPVLDSVS